MATYLDHPRIAEKLLDQQGQINDAQAALIRVQQLADELDKAGPLPPKQIIVNRLRAAIADPGQPAAPDSDAADTHPFEQDPDAERVHVCRCDTWPLHHIHTGDRAACTCDDCTRTPAQVPDGADTYNPEWHGLAPALWPDDEDADTANTLLAHATPKDDR